MRFTEPLASWLWCLSGPGSCGRLIAPSGARAWRRAADAGSVMWSAARELAERCVGGPRFGNWLFMHNGAIAGFSSLQRDLAFAVDPSLYPHIQGTTDSEVLFHLALTLGLREDPIAAMAKAIQMAESAATSTG